MKRTYFPLNSWKKSGLLSNSELDSASPFAGILLGQPTLASRLRQGIFAALDQRISVRYSLGGMDLAELVAYLRHHLALAGRADPIVADDAAAAPAPLCKWAAPGAQQRGHGRLDGGSGGGQGPGRRHVRQKGDSRAHPHLTPPPPS